MYSMTVWLRHTFEVNQNIGLLSHLSNGGWGGSEEEKQHSIYGHSSHKAWKENARYLETWAKKEEGEDKRMSKTEVSTVTN